MQRKKKKSDNKKPKKIGRHLVERYWEDIWLSCSMNGAIKNITESTGSEWRKIGDDRRKIHSSDIIRICS